MKAQMTIEFIVAAVIFFSLVLYIVVYLNASLSEYREEFYVSDMQSRAIQISDLLVHNKDIGLSCGYPVLNTSLIDAMQDRCNNQYPDMLRGLDLENNRIKIQINKSLGREIMLDCPDVINIPEAATKVGMTRFGVLNRTYEPVIMSLWIW